MQGYHALLLDKPGKNRKS